MASIFAESSAQISRKSNEVGVNQIFRENLVTGGIGNWNGRVLNLGSGGSCTAGKQYWRKGSWEQLVWRCAVTDKSRLWSFLRTGKKRVTMVSENSTGIGKMSLTVLAQ